MDMQKLNSIKKACWVSMTGEIGIVFSSADAEVIHALVDFYEQHNQAELKKFDALYWCECGEYDIRSCGKSLYYNAVTNQVTLADRDGATLHKADIDDLIVTFPLTQADLGTAAFPGFGGIVAKESVIEELVALGATVLDTFN